MHQFYEPRSDNFPQIILNKLLWVLSNAICMQWPLHYFEMEMRAVFTAAEMIGEFNVVFFSKLKYN